LKNLTSFLSRWALPSNSARPSELHNVNVVVLPENVNRLAVFASSRSLYNVCANYRVLSPANPSTKGWHRALSECSVSYAAQRDGLRSSCNLWREGLAPQIIHPTILQVSIVGRRNNIETCINYCKACFSLYFLKFCLPIHLLTVFIVFRL
jgi:hypothetical protein